MSILSNGRPQIALARVFERVSAATGKKYFVGRVGSAKLLIVPTDIISRGEPVWDVVLGEGFYEERNSIAAAQGIDDEPAPASSGAAPVSNGAVPTSNKKTLSLPVR
jgi:hypothetical protein